MATKRTKKTEAASSPVAVEAKPEPKVAKPELKPAKKAAKPAAKPSAPRAKKTVEAVPPPVESKPTDTISLAALRDEISALAHQLWIENGCRHGYAHEDWSRAELAVKAKYGI
ncbi:MAG: DUF2934 domain-containing protein [Bryobacteraceae bacterium]|nr:DUF2934 domain-containing protein [Bryobacteraceae bacterium]